MAVDEAILRVILQGQGGAGGTPGLPGGGGGTGGSGGAGAPKTPDFFQVIQPVLSSLGKSITNVISKIGGTTTANWQKAALASQGIDPSGGAGLAGGLAGPAAVAVAALFVLDKLKDSINDTIDSIGKFSAGLLSASTDPSQGVMLFGSAIKGAGDKLFWLSPVLGTFGSVIGQTTTSIGELMQAMDGMVDRYAMYSPGIAYASAQAQITQIMNDFKRAQQVTPSLVQYLQARTELQQKYEDLKAKFLVQATPALIFAMKVLEVLLEALNKWLGVQDLAGFDADVFQSIGDIIMKNRGEFGKIFATRDIPPFAR